MSKKVLHIHCVRSNNKLVFTGDNKVLKLLEDIALSDDFFNLVVKLFLD